MSTPLEEVKGKKTKPKKKAKPVEVIKEPEVIEPETPEPTWLDRVKDELEELNIKCKALYSFTRGTKFTDSSPGQQELMLAQEKAMLAYSDILKKRIDLEN